MLQTVIEGNKEIKIHSFVKYRHWLKAFIFYMPLLLRFKKITTLQAINYICSIMSIR